MAVTMESHHNAYYTACGCVCSQSHYTRSYLLNRQRALAILRQKLDIHYHGDESISSKAKRQAAVEKEQRRQKSRQKQEKVRAFKESLRTLQKTDALPKTSVDGDHTAVDK